MKKINIITPENIEVEYKLADLTSRTGAAAIDMLLQGLLLVILGIGIFLIAYFSPEFWEDYYGWIIGIALILFSLISYGYFIVMELTMNGQTLGKKLLKLRAIRNNGEPITLKHSAIRNLFRVFLDVFGLGVMFIFFSKEHKRIGDFAAATIVVLEENKTSPITLESLQNHNDFINYYLSEEEQELLREYFKRKDSLENFEELRRELKAYFSKKFEALGKLEEVEELISSL